MVSFDILKFQRVGAGREGALAKLRELWGSTLRSEAGTFRHLGGVPHVRQIGDWIRNPVRAERTE